MDMTSYSEGGKKVPRMSEGILLPLLVHRFRIVFPANTPNAVSAQASRCSMNFLEKWFKVEVQQPLLDMGVMETIANMMRIPFPQRVAVDLLDGDAKTVRRIEFVNLQATNHLFELDYAANEVATHYLDFSFDDVESSEMVYETDTKPDPA